MASSRKIRMKCRIHVSQNYIQTRMQKSGIESERKNKDAEIEGQTSRNSRMKCRIHE